MRRLKLNTGDVFAKNELDPPEFLIERGPVVILIRESFDESMEPLYAEAEKNRQSDRARRVLDKKRAI